MNRCSGALEIDIFYDETLPLHRVAATWFNTGVLEGPKASIE